jgi:hypothetical protein
MLEEGLMIRKEYQRRSRRVGMCNGSVYTNHSIEGDAEELEDGIVESKEIEFMYPNV